MVQIIELGVKTDFLLKILAIFVISFVIGMMLMLTKVHAADDGVSFEQELENIAANLKPPFSENFVSAFLADSRFSKYVTSPPVDNSMQEKFAKMAFGQYMNEQVSQALSKPLVSSTDFKDLLDAHIDSNFNSAPETALKKGLPLYIKEKYPKGLPDPMTVDQISNFLSDFSSWMKFTPYGKLGGILSDEDGLDLIESLKLNIYDPLVNEIRENARNGDYLPDTIIYYNEEGTAGRNSNRDQGKLQGGTGGGNNNGGSD